MSKVKRDLRKVLGFTANMQEMGLSPSTKVLSKKIVPANLSRDNGWVLRRGPWS